MEKKRSVGSIIIAICYLIIFLAGVIGLSAPSKGAGGNPLPTILISLYAVACATGLVLMKNWGRILVIISAIFLLIILVTAAIIGICKGQILIVIPMFLPISIPAAILIYLARPKVKEQFK